jgi:hypothetical protein
MRFGGLEPAVAQDERRRVAGTSGEKLCATLYGVFGLNALSTSVRSSETGTWPVVA